MLVTKQQSSIDKFMQMVQKRNPGESEFHQAVYEVAQSLIPFIEEHPEYKKAAILERMTEADRIVIFRVPWVDDAGNYPCESRLPGANE